MASKQVMSDVPKEAIDIHNNLKFELKKQIKGEDFEDLKELFKDNPLTSVEVDEMKNIYELFRHLIKNTVISVGNYQEFVSKLEHTIPNLVVLVRTAEMKINDIINGSSSEVKRLRTEDHAPGQSTDQPPTKPLRIENQSQGHLTEIHPYIKTVIDKTNITLTEERKKGFIDTKGCDDAWEKLQKNGVVIIKGNIGDGKTTIAVQLTHRLIQQQPDRRPLQFYEIVDIDYVAPNSKFIIFFDDIFGEKVLRKSEVAMWNKRIFSEISRFRGDNQTQSNFLIITVRNEVYNSVKNCFLETVFTSQDIIDLGSNTYKLSEAKKIEFLELYAPKDSTFSWHREDKDGIAICAQNIGFPLCCLLFRDNPDLQKEPVNFFKNPICLFKKVLSKSGEFSAAFLFLFLIDGILRVGDLDPYSEKVNRILLEKAFEIDLCKDVDDRSKLTYQKKVAFVKTSLDTLSGFLVVKEKDWRSGDDVYRFYHDSIYVAVALLYGKVTPIGYIQNCPSKSLSHISTTSTTSTVMIVISPDHYTYMCERLIKEFEIKGYYYGAIIASLDVWNDKEFVKQFVILLNDKKVDKLALLNKACSYGAEECALYLLREGVKHDKDTPFRIVDGRSLKVLKKIIDDLNDDIKLALLNYACSADSLECAIFILSKGVKPNKHTKLWSLISIERFKGDWGRLERVYVYLNEETRRDMLNKACSNGTEECASNLLSMGVQPDNETPFYVVERGSVNVLRKLLQYDVTPTARDDYNNNVLYHSCLYERGEMVTILCDTYQHLAHDPGWLGLTPLLVVAVTGNCSMFQTVEKTIHKSLHRAESEQHKCESVDGRVVHRSCACAQYMSQVVDNYGYTVLHMSYRWGHKELCLYLCQSYPALTTVVDKYGRHCLHYIAEYKSDVDMFTECETHVKQYLESTGHTYDITAILDSRGESVLDKARTRKQGEAKYQSIHLHDYLVRVFGK